MKVMTADCFEQVLTALNDRSLFQPLTVRGADRRDCFEVDHPKATVVRDGVAVYLKPGGIPVWSGHEGVTQGIGDIADARA